MKFYVNVEVTRARGRETWVVEAESEGDAIEKWQQGGGDLYDQELESEDFGAITAKEAKSCG